MRQDNGKTVDIKRGEFSGDKNEYDFIHMELEVLLKLSVEDLQ